MDSQEQYEALLKRWGFEDRSVERRMRRQKIARTSKAIIKTIKKSFNTVENLFHTTSHSRP